MSSRTMTPEQYKEMQKLLKHPNAQRWLATIKFAEGTDKGDNPYGTAFTGRQFDNNLPHPEIAYTSKSGYRSAAHGAYQAMPDTWKEAFGSNKPMTKDNQDVFALWKIRQRGVDPSTPISRQSAAFLAPEWASFPKMNGLSYYGQPVKGYDVLEKSFNDHKVRPQTALSIQFGALLNALKRRNRDTLKP